MEEIIHRISAIAIEKNEGEYQTSVMYGACECGHIEWVNMAGDFNDKLKEKFEDHFINEEQKEQDGALEWRRNKENN